MSLRSRIPELLVLLLALVIRLWQLDYHSFWFDETVSMTWARSTPAYAWESTFELVKDKHPPAYYLLLHFWRELFRPFGLENNDIILRLLGSLLGVLTVLGVLVLANRLSGRRTALLAGALVALSPALVWYSQELRMFQPAATGLVWAAACLAFACTTPVRRTRGGWWLAMVIAFTLALYSYLFAAFALPAAGLVLLGPLFYFLRARRAGPDAPNAPDASGLGIFLEGTVALTVTGLLFLPLARNAWLANASEGAPGVAFMDFSANLLRQLQVATIWRVEWDIPIFTIALFLFGALLAAGLLLPGPRIRTPQFRARAPGDQHPGESSATGSSLPGADDSARTVLLVGDRLVLWAWLAGPLLVGNLLLTRNDTIFAEDRYFLYLVPFVLWAVARGVVAISARWRPALWLLSVAAALLLAAALPRLWSPAMLREDWRAAAFYIADYQEASPGLSAAAVAHVDYTRTPLNWYLRKQLTREQLPVYFPFGGQLTPAAVDELVAPPLRGIEDSGVATLWLTQSHLEGIDDTRVVEAWLNAAYPLITEQYPAGIKLSGYAVQHRFAELPELTSAAVLPQAELAPGLTLAACEILTSEVSARDERMHPPSGWVHVRLWWQATGPIAADYMATVRMVGPEGVWGERLYRDNETLRRWPTSSWDHRDYMRDEVDVNLNPVTPPGTYPIIVGLMDVAGNETGETVECGRVRIN